MLLAGDYIPKLKSVRFSLPAGRILANLEGPIIGNALIEASPKAGPALMTERLSLDGRDFIFALANNHVMDYGREGLRLTRQALTGAGVSFCGAGENRCEARAPVIIEEAGKRIGIISCCERQFGVSDAEHAGVAEKGWWLIEAVRSLKSRVHHVVVSCHAASEFSPWPSPDIRECYRGLIDSGADIIHGHHSHVPQGYESYGGGAIFYGLGNFVINTPDWGNTWAPYLWSLLVDVDFSGPELRWSVQPCTVKCNREELLVSSVGQAEFANYKEYIDKANLAMADETLSLGLWQEVSVRLYHGLYEQSLRAFGVESFPLSRRDRIRKCAFALFDIITAAVGREHLSKRGLHYGRVRYNLANCQSHVEAIRTALGVLTGSVADYRSERTRKLANEMLPPKW